MLFRRQSRRALLAGLSAAVAGAFVRSTLAMAHADFVLPPFVQTREAWGATPATARMRRHTIERVTLHHTGPPAWEGVPSVAAYLRGIQAFHMGPERGWADIAYHLLIDLDGGVWEGRSLAYAGDTATAYDPAGHALMAVLGDYDQQRPSDAQVEAIARTVQWVTKAYGLDGGTLAGHRDYAPTACPGRTLYDLLDVLRARV